jgi:hypothetical protein
MQNLKISYKPISQQPFIYQKDLDSSFLFVNKLIILLFT